MKARRVIDDDGQSQNKIKTIPGVGFRFTEEVFSPCLKSSIIVGDNNNGQHVTTKLSAYYCAVGLFVINIFFLLAHTYFMH